ncbi:hypothetical protein [Methylobacterium oryzisoli]|uniref:hypothetical protein n=1 Tax=Methylobacterium oryzisoli TaxID=3385502 RepID=UPI00389255AA
MRQPVMSPLEVEAMILDTIQGFPGAHVIRSIRLLPPRRVGQLPSYYLDIEDGAEDEAMPVIRFIHRMLRSIYCSDRKPEATKH